MHKALLIDPRKCTSCMQCELACSFEHTGAFNPARSRIKIFEFEHGARSIPYTCTQCEEAWCLHACPVEAITVNPATGAKEVDPNVCVGCKVCTIACPFGTINYSADTGKVVKCDLCGGNPQCAEACPTGAITYVDASWTGLGRMQASAVAAPRAAAGRLSRRNPRHGAGGDERTSGARLRRRGRPARIALRRTSCADGLLQPVIPAKAGIQGLS